MLTVDCRDTDPPLTINRIEQNRIASTMSDDFTIEIEDAQSDLVRIADIDGRDVVVFPERIGTGKGDDGKPYPYLQADVIVLNGPTTDLIDEVPCVVTSMRLTSSPLLRNGERMLKKGTGKPFAGRINSQKGKFGNKAYGITTWDPDAPVRALANAEAAKYIKNRPSVTEDASDENAFN